MPVCRSTRGLLRWTSVCRVQACQLATSPALQVRLSSTRSEAAPSKSLLPKEGPGLDHFIQQAAQRKPRLPKVTPSVAESHEYIAAEDLDGNGRKVLLVTYGCQMNVNDMEVVRSILMASGYLETTAQHDADVILLMTCSIREGAEDKIWGELKRLKRTRSKSRTVAVLGCMAERLKHDLLEKGDLCQVVAGPDSYRDLPRLLAVSQYGQKALNVQLSLEETYADVAPVRVDPEGKTAFVSIMRGCDNMCTYCIVPFTRGRERSRPIDSIIEEVSRLSQQGVRQVTLLGQNVNSYRDTSESSISWGQQTSTVPGFKTVYTQKSGGRTFATLLEHVSRVDPEMRIRFTSPHPKDFPMEVIQLIRDTPNICNQIHLPAQSGDTGVLASMGRGYSRETYLDLVRDIRQLIPDVHLTSDFIAGFCGESEEAHANTVSLIKEVGYSFCYVFPYSMRESTRAHRQLTDDVPDEIKKRRHEELAATFREHSHRWNTSRIGSKQLVLLEGVSKRSATAMAGRNDGGVKVIFETPEDTRLLPGQYVQVQIEGASSQSLKGRFVKESSVREWKEEEEERT